MSTRQKQRLGDCASVAASYVLDVDPTAYVCHGYPTAQPGGNAEQLGMAGKQIWHAWVETADGLTVIEKSNGLDMRLPAFMYYRIGKLDPADVKRYNAVEVAVNVRREGHWGPWGES